MWLGDLPSRQAAILFQFLSHFHIQALKEDEKKYADTKTNLRLKIRDMRRKVICIVCIMYVCIHASKGQSDGLANQ